MKFISVYITAPNKSEALAIAKTLVTDGLVKCANIFDQVTSIYEWRGSVLNDYEYVLICKARSANFKKIVATVKKLSSYDCPCVLSMPILDGNPEYLKWLNEKK